MITQLLWNNNHSSSLFNHKNTHMQRTIFHPLFWLLILGLLHSYANAQSLDIIPSYGPGKVNFYHNIDVTLSDTGTIGSNQIWDFSNYSYTSPSWEEVHRDLDAAEALNYPDANVAVQKNGTIQYYNQSVDSTVIIGSYSESNGIGTSYTNVETEFDSSIYFNTSYADSFSYNYYSGTTLVTVEGYSSWIASAQGELRTPTMIYPNTYKVTTTSVLKFYAQGALVEEVNSTIARWYSENLSSVLMEVEYNDYDNITQGRFLENESFASIQGKEKDPLLIYPNPNQGVFTIRYDNNAEPAKNITITDMVGRIVFEENIENLSGTYEKTVDLTEFGTGLYILKIHKENTKEVNELVIY